MKDLTDARLLELIKENPERGFHLLYERYAGPLLRFLFRFTGAQETAEELLHDLFAEFLRGNFENRGNEGLKGWLFTVARHKGLNHRRRAQREVAMDSLDDLTTLEDLKTLDTPEAVLSAAQQREFLTRCEACLPQDLAETWKLRREGCDYEQIAARLDIPLGTVKSRFHRLVRHLRKEFES